MTCLQWPRLICLLSTRNYRNTADNKTPLIPPPPESMSWIIYSIKAERPRMHFPEFQFTYLLCCALGRDCDGKDLRCVEMGILYQLRMVIFQTDSRNMISRFERELIMMVVCGQGLSSPWLGMERRMSRAPHARIY